MEFDSLKVSKEDLEPTPVNEPTKFLSDEIATMLTTQVGHEMFAFYEYTAISVWFEAQGLPGFAAWAKKQAGDESCHMQKVLCYLIEVGATPTLPSVPEAPSMATDVKAAVQAILTREKSVTMNWHNIAKKAMEDTDVATIQLAQWFMTEQMEEENLVKVIMQRVAMADTTTGILVLDEQLADQYGK